MATVEVEQEQTTTRICNSCARELPITEFRYHYRATGDRHRDCNACHLKNERELRERRRANKFHRLTARMAHARPGKCEKFLGIMLERVGNYREIAERFHHAIMHGRSGTRHQLDALTAITNMARDLSAERAAKEAAAAAKQAQANQDDVDDMNDQEIEHELLLRAVHLATKHPEYRSWVLEALDAE